MSDTNVLTFKIGRNHSTKSYFRYFGVVLLIVVLNSLFFDQSNKSR